MDVSTLFPHDTVCKLRMQRLAYLVTETKPAFSMKARHARLFEPDIELELTYDVGTQPLIPYY